MDTWHHYTLRANTEFQLAFYGNAILMHNQALDFARHDFDSHVKVCVHHALARVLISHFSLADCYSALEEFERAAACYLDAQRFLLHSSEQLPATELTAQAIQHANSHLHTLWCGLLREHQAHVPFEAQLTYHQNSKALQATSLRCAVLH